jgi:hypothetical protein
MQKSRLNSLTLTLSRREREQKAAVFDIPRLPWQSSCKCCRGCVLNQLKHRLDLNWPVSSVIFYSIDRF